MSLVKVERHVRISRISGAILIKPGQSVYFLVPSDVCERLKEEEGIDLKDKKVRKNIGYRCSFTKEREEGSNPFEIRIIHSLMLPGELLNKKPGGR